MRRLWAYIIVVFAAVVAVFASFPSVAKGMTNGGEFISRRVFTFQLKQKEAVDLDDGEEVVPLNENSAKDMANIMKMRLDAYNVSSYDIETKGNDIITVSFPAENDEMYKNIVTYLSFSGSFAIANNYSDFVVEGKEFLNGAAYTKSYSLNEYPTIIIPVKTDSENYKTLIQDCVDHPESKEVPAEDGGEATTESVSKLYFLYNWQKGETYQILNETGRLQSKILLTIEFQPDEERTGLYYDSNKNSFYQTCGYVDSNGSGYADPSEVKAAYAQADYLLNLFSASKLDYEVNCIKGLSDDTQEVLTPKTEAVESKKGHLAWNRTLTAIIAFMLIITLLLVFFYKLGAASVFATTLASVFFSLLMMVNAGLEYNSLGVVAFVAVAILSLVSGIIYLNKLKEDSYRGHTLKKANAEASKKSLLPIIDIHVVAIVVGIFTYVFGGTPLRSFSTILAIGGLISLIFATLGLKGLMWLPTNATALNNRYDLFGIDQNKVPNHMAEEKQSFYGDYADKDFTKRKKPVGIITGCAFLLGLVGMVTFGALRGGDLLKQPASQSLGNEIFIQNRILVANDETESPLDDTSLKTILDNILLQEKADTPIDDSDDTTYYTLNECIKDKDLFSVEDTRVEEGSSNTYRTTYFRLTLSKKVSGNEIAKVKGYTPAEGTTLNGILSELFDSGYSITADFEPNTDPDYPVNTMKIKTVETVVNPSSPRWEGIILGSAIAVAVITLYLSLRYRLSRGISSLIFPVVGSVITVGIVLLFNLFLSMSASVFIAVPMVVIFSYLYLIQFYNKERELLLEDRVKDNSKEHRAEVAKRALGIAYTPILATAVIGIYALINFFGFAPSVMSNAYAFAFIGSLVALGVITVLLVPNCNALFNALSKLGVRLARAPKEKKNKSNKPVKRSAEPEEAIFIGIND